MNKIILAFFIIITLSVSAQDVLLDADYPAATDLLLTTDGGSLSQEVKIVNDDTVFVSSIAELREAAHMENRIIRMIPGTYTFEGTMPNDPKTIVHFDGSGNEFIFTDVNLMLPCAVMAAMGPGSTHEFDVYRIEGSNLIFRGGHFENTGDEKPYKSLAKFEVKGNNISFYGCTIIIRGSQPYGYGDMYGKGSGSAVALYKYSAMSILGDDVLVDGCNFEVYSFGHGIHIHGSQNTIIRDVNMLGAVRLTDEIYEETSGPAFDFGFTIQYPDWKLNDPIPKGEMLHLTEDGIRAYLDGDDINGVSRRTGHITVENCYVDKMRGGITLALGSGGATVTGCTSVNCEHAYSMPSNATVRNCKGNVAYGPLLSLPYDHKGSADIELELIPSDSTMGIHNFAEITGSNHKIKITCADENYTTDRSFVIGSAGVRYMGDDIDEQTKIDSNGAKSCTVTTSLDIPMQLTKYSSSCKATTKGVISDSGTSNTVTTVE